MTGSQAGKLMPRGNGKLGLVFRKNERTSVSNHPPPAVEIKPLKKKGLPGAAVMVVMVLHSWALERKHIEQKKAHFRKTSQIRCGLKTVVYAQCFWALVGVLGGPRSTENGTRYNTERFR